MIMYYSLFLRSLLLPFVIDTVDLYFAVKDTSKRKTAPQNNTNDVERNEILFPPFVLVITATMRTYWKTSLPYHEDIFSFSQRPNRGQAEIKKR